MSQDRKGYFNINLKDFKEELYEFLPLYISTNLVTPYGVLGAPKNVSEIFRQVN